jgi:hypothetical protein
MHPRHERARGVASLPPGEMSEMNRAPASSDESALGKDHTREESPFHCSAERHLVRMSSRFAPALYSWARRLSRNSRVFSASAENVAKHFEIERKTVLRALEELSTVGFFELIRIERFKPSVYRVVDHKEWAKSHPGRCVEKDTLPWEGEGDPLGRQLFAISGQRTRFLPNQVTGLRRLGFSDGQIEEAYRAFLDEQDYEGKQWKRAYYDFHAHLQSLLAVSLPVAPNANAELKDSCDAEYHRRDSGGVPPEVRAGVPSRSNAEYRRRDASLRSEFPKGAAELKCSIPALRSQERLANRPTDLVEIPGRGEPPSKPSPEEKSLREAEQGMGVLRRADVTDKALERMWEAMQLSPDVANASFRGVLQHFVRQAPDAPIHENLDRTVTQLRTWGLEVGPEILAAKERLIQDAFAEWDRRFAEWGEPFPERCR